MRGLLCCIGALALIAGASSTAQAGPPALDGFVSASPLAAFDMPADGHGPSEKGIMEMGLGADAHWRLSRRFEVCVGLRYDVGFGEEDTGHFLAAPVTGRLIVPLAPPGHELRVGLGLGLAVGIVGDLLTLGPTAELGVGYHHAISSDLGGFVYAGVRFELLSEQNADPDSYLEGGTLVNGQFPFVRAGVTWH